MNASTAPFVFRLLKNTILSWSKHRALNLSAALAYYSIFSIAPLLIIAIALAGLVFGQEAAQGKISEQVQSYIGHTGAKGIESMIKAAAKPSHGWIGATVGFVTLLLGASGVFGQLKEALNTVWSVQQKSGGGVGKAVRERLLSFGMVLVIGFLLLTSLILTSIVAAANTYVNHLLGLPAPVWAAISFVVSFAVVTVLFALIFKVLPDAKIQWKDVWIGAVATGVLFEIGKFGLSYYLGRESTESSYGAAGSIILVLLWIYYASCILLLGAEFTRVYAQEKGRAIEPTEAAERVTEAEVAANPTEEVKHPPIEHLPAFYPQKTNEVPTEKPQPVLGKKLARVAGIAAAAFLAGRLTKKTKTFCPFPGQKSSKVPRVILGTPPVE